MLEKLSCCPACGAKDITPHLTCEDYSVSRQSFHIDQCQQCQLLFTNPRPDTDHIGQYYQSDEYISHTNKTRSLLDVVYKLVRSYTLRKKITLINSHATHKTLLDYGCGTGHFLRQAINNRWLCHGIEPNLDARTTAELLTHATVLPQLGDIPALQTFSIITLWHVLEHVHRLNYTFHKLASHLKRDGKIIIAVPNHRSYDAQVYGSHWAAYDVPRHLYHFNSDSMRVFLNRHRMKIEKILPMKFDSFYVSLLSEQQKNQRKNIIRSMINGYNSNSYGYKTGEYSSLIYIASFQ